MYCIFNCLLTDSAGGKAPVIVINSDAAGDNGMLLLVLVLYWFVLKTTFKSTRDCQVFLNDHCSSVFGFEIFV